MFDMAIRLLLFCGQALALWAHFVESYVFSARQWNKPEHMFFHTPFTQHHLEGDVND